MNEFDEFNQLLENPETIEYDRYEVVNGKRVKCKYNQPLPIYAPSCVDESFFRPSVDDVHNYQGGSTRTPLYDFPDGVDTGLDLTSIRDKSLDITEHEANLKALQSKVNKDKSVLNREVELALQEEIEKSSTSKVSDSTSSDSAE